MLTLGDACMEWCCVGMLPCIVDDRSEMLDLYSAHALKAAADCSLPC